MGDINFASRSVGWISRHLDSGIFALPKLQREFVWNGARAAALLDSMYHNIPIGTIFLWNSSASRRYLLRQHSSALPPFDASNRRIWFLIDGQQRLSVIHHALHGGEQRNSGGQIVKFDHLVLDLQAPRDDVSRVQLFAYRRPVPGRFISAPAILGTNWRKRCRVLGPRRLARVVECRNRLLNYRVPVVSIQTHDVEEVRAAFIRINAQGMRIASADQAFARATRIDLRERAIELRERLHGTFSRIDYGVLLAAFGFATVKEVDVGQRALDAVVTEWERRVSDSGESLFARRWRDFEEAFTKALDFLKTNFFVLNMDFLPSANMLATLTVFFMNHSAQPTTRARQEIRKWFWATALGQRYTGRGYRQNITKDVAFFRRLASGGGRFNWRPSVERSDIIRAEYTRPGAIPNAFLCLLASYRPRYLTNGELVPLEGTVARANRRDKHHIFPRQLLANYGFGHREYNSVVNICFIVAEENQSIGGARSPRKYLGEFRSRRHFRRFAESHLIPAGDESGLWDQGVAGAFKRFRKSRQAMVCKAFETTAGIRLFRRD